MDPRPKRLLKALGIMFLLAVGLFILLYTSAWFAITKRADAYIALIWASPDFTFSSSPPTLSGFPLAPEFDYSGIIQDRNGFRLELPNLYYSGFPLNGQQQYLEAKNGLTLSAPFLENIIHIDYAAMQFRVPYHVPARFHAEDLEKWRDRNEPLQITKFVIQYKKASILGMGNLTLDDNLQIKGDFAIRLLGGEDILNEMGNKMSSQNLAMIQSFYNALSQYDEETKTRYFETTLRVQNNGVYFGPLRIATLPRISWEGQKVIVPRRVAPELQPLTQP